MSTQATAGNNRIPELDGLRGIAVLMVVLWHYVQNAVQVHPGTALAYLFVGLRLTWSGVDLFFVLSGFLIGGILLKTRSSPGYFRTFYGRRAGRILPLYAVWTAVFLVVLGLWLPQRNSIPGAIFNRDIHPWAYLLFVQNFSMSMNQTFGAHWMAVTWSLAVEEQAYLVLPLIIRYVRAVFSLMLALIGICPVVRLVLFNSGNIYFGPYTLIICRADSFGFGVLAAMLLNNSSARRRLEAHRTWLMAALSVLAIGVVGLTFLPRYGLLLTTFGYTWLAGFFACLLVSLAIGPPTRMKRFFRSAALVYIGGISYAIYIFHQGVNHLFHYFIDRSTPAIHDIRSLGITVLSFAVVLLLATLSQKYFEGPILRFAHAQFPYRRAEARAYVQAN